MKLLQELAARVVLKEYFEERIKKIKLESIIKYNHLYRKDKEKYLEQIEGAFEYDEDLPDHINEILASHWKDIINEWITKIYSFFSEQCTKCERTCFPHLKKGMFNQNQRFCIYLYFDYYFNKSINKKQFESHYQEIKHYEYCKYCRRINDDRAYIYIDLHNNGKNNGYCSYSCIKKGKRLTG